MVAPPRFQWGLDGKTFQIDIFKGKLFYQPQPQLQLQLAKTLAPVVVVVRPLQWVKPERDATQTVVVVVRPEV